jgi:hypothetical protein
MKDIQIYVKIAGATIGLILYCGFLYMMIKIGFLAIVALEKYLGI